LFIEINENRIFFHLFVLFFITVLALFLKLLDAGIIASFKDNLRENIAIICNFLKIAKILMKQSSIAGKKLFCLLQQ
jgi:hypothetical protein